MASVIQFVDSIASSPTVRLDVNSASSTLMLGDSGIDLSPPPFNEAIASTLLQDGDQIAAGAFGNRTIKLPVKLVYASSTDAGATAIQNLARELNRPTNILKVQLDGATSPVFFKTFRAPSFVLSMLRLQLTANTETTLEIPAEYAGYGLLETPVNGVTVDTNPAAATNPCYVDIATVKGDVETPAIIRWPSAAIADDREAIFAIRRRGTPSSAPFLIQAEAMTQGTDTTTQPNDVNFSGAGNNFSRTTFATNATMVSRLQVLTVGTSGVNLRGTYRVYVRYDKSVGSDGINLQLVWGPDSFGTVFNDAVATASTINTTTADLGLISIPSGIDPAYGPDGVELPVSNTFLLQLRAERTSGAGTIDIDFLILVPADDTLGIVHWDDDSSSPTDHWILNADGTVPYARDSSDNIISTAAPSITGLPFLAPNQANRIYMLRSTRAGDPWALTTVTPVSVSYYPRYLTVRPAST